ncbi:MAG: hypothetical protein L0Y57_08440 [Beijerinckiaceae bacterium]|nr:hypothetical protein [Beijerinckiaceae bacterium]
MKHNATFAGLAAATALFVTAAFAGGFNSATVRKNDILPVAHSAPKAVAGKVYCFNGLKADQIDKWAPNYHGWTCVPDNRR